MERSVRDQTDILNLRQPSFTEVRSSPTLQQGQGRYRFTRHHRMYLITATTRRHDSISATREIYTAVLPILPWMYLNREWRSWKAAWQPWPRLPGQRPCPIPSRT